MSNAKVWLALAALLACGVVWGQDGGAGKPLADARGSGGGAQPLADARGSGGAADAKTPEALTGESYAEFARLRMTALEARREHLAKVVEAQQKIQEADALARAAADAERELAAWALEASGGRRECAPQTDGSWRCGGTGAR